MEIVNTNLESLFEDAEVIDPNIDYRQQMFDKYENYVHEEIIDDSWIEDIDKVNLISHCKDTVNTHYKQYPSPMSEILIKKIYYNTIKKMDKEEYFREKEENKNKSILELELSKIDKYSGI